MPAFPKPSFPYTFSVASERGALRRWRDTEPGRAIPSKTPDHMLLCTWNVANLGLQQREPRHHQLIAEIISWFDMIALQECNDNLEGLRGVMAHLPNGYQTIFTDEGGNNERMAFIYDSNKVSPLEMIGEIAVPPSEHRWIKLPGVSRPFNGFDRNPYLAAFAFGKLEFILVNVHLFFGDESEANIDRRSLETYAVGRWADLRRKSKHRYVDHIIALGDFNMPKALPGDPIYKALTKRGLRIPPHSSEIAATISSDNHYDQIAFFPGSTRHLLTDGPRVFDFDGGVFASLWNSHTPSQFKKYVKYYLSDHRPVWMQLKQPAGT